MFRGKDGYTLIELIVVIIIAGLLISFSIPRFQESIISDNLKISTRKIIGLINSLRDDAIGEKRTYILKFEKISGLYWIESTDMSEIERSLAKENAMSLPNDITIKDILIMGTENKMQEAPGIYLNLKGYVQPSMIRIGSDDGRELTIILRPFLREIDVIEGQVETDTIRF